MDPITAGLIGAGVSGLAGAIGGGLTQGEANERAREARDKLKKQATKVEGEYGQIERKWDPYAQGLGDDYANYKAANEAFIKQAQNYRPTQEWDYDLKKGISDVWDPYFQEKVDLAAKQVYGGAANAGKLMSSASSRNVAQAVGKQYDESYQAALNAAQEQERQEYQWYAEQVARERAAVDQANQIRLQNVQNYGEAVNKGFNALQSQSQIGMNKISDVANLNTAAINAGAQQASPYGAAFSAAGQNLAGFGNTFWGGNKNGTAPIGTSNTGSGGQH